MPVKKSLFISCFIGVHILFVLLVIHKQNKFIEFSYEKQRKEKMIAQLRELKKKLERERYILTSYERVKSFAQKELGMEPMSIKQFRNI